MSYSIENVKLDITLLVYPRLASFIAMETPMLHNIKLTKRDARRNNSFCDRGDKEI